MWRPRARSASEGGPGARSSSARRPGVWFVALLAAVAACSSPSSGTVGREGRAAPSTTDVAPLSTTPDSDTTAPAEPEYHVAPGGADEGPGTESAPFETLTAAFRRLRPGDTLIVHEGRYDEDVVLKKDELNSGTPDAPIEARARPGERVVIEGRLALYDADHWTIRGIDVTWSDRNGPSDHMVVFNGGTGFRFTDAEVWGARSYAGIVVGLGSRDFRLDHLFVHDTHPSNDVNQDHLIYLGSDAVGGVVERNVLVRSPNGRGVKLGPGDLSETGAHANVIRFNTFYENEGPSAIQLSGDSSDNEIYGNLLVRPGGGNEAITAWRLDGRDNIVRDNLAWDAESVVESDSGLLDRGGNAMVDPMFAAVDEDDYRPTNPAARRYGAHAER